MADEELAEAPEQEDIVPETEGQDAAPNEEESDPPSEIEVLAAEMGWRPKSQWDGDEGDFIEAKEFLKNTREVNRSYRRELKDMKKQLEGIGKATARMTQRAVEEERKRLEQLHDRAVEDGDAKAAREAMKAMQGLQSTPVDAPPEAQEFAQKHSAWFGKDDEATTFAQVRCDEYARQGLSPKRQLAAVEKDMREHFPDLFPQEAKQKAPPSLGAPQRQVATQPREKGYATLPPAARKACDQWVAEQKENGNSWATKDAWAASFYDQEAANG